MSMFDFKYIPTTECKDAHKMGFHVPTRTELDHLTPGNLVIVHTSIGPIQYMVLGDAVSQNSSDQIHAALYHHMASQDLQAANDIPLKSILHIDDRWNFTLLELQSVYVYHKPSKTCLSLRDTRTFEGAGSITIKDIFKKSIVTPDLIAECMDFYSDYTQLLSHSLEEHFNNIIIEFEKNRVITNLYDSQSMH